MGVIRTTGLAIIIGSATLAAVPAAAQTVTSPQTAYLVMRPEIREKLEEKTDGLWIRAQSSVRTNNDAWRADETKAVFSFSVQKEVADHAWLGLITTSSPRRYDGDRIGIRNTRNYAGARVSVEPSSGVELGFAWLRRVGGKQMVRGVAGWNRGVKPGPKAYMQFHF